MKMISSKIRMCVVTRKRETRENLIQITKINNEWQINNKAYQGRSIYLLEDSNVIKKFLKQKKKIKNFELTDELKKELTNYAENL